MHGACRMRITSNWFLIIPVRHFLPTFGSLGELVKMVKTFSLGVIATWISTEHPDGIIENIDRWEAQKWASIGCSWQAIRALGALSNHGKQSGFRVKGIEVCRKMWRY